MPRRVGGAPRRRRHDAAGRRVRRRADARVLRRDRPRHVPRQQRQLPQPPRQARRARSHVQTHHGTPLKHMGLDLRRSAESQGRGMDFDKLLEPLRALGLQRLVEPPSRPRSGSACTPAPTSRSRSATRATTCSRTRRRRMWRASALGARDRGRADDRALRANSPRVRGRLRARSSIWRGSPTALGPDHVILARLHYFYDSDPLVRELHDAGRLLRRGVPSLGRGALPGGRRAAHGLLLDHVRLRRARPPDRHPRSRLGRIPRPPRHVLRPARRAARGGHAHRRTKSSRRCAGPPSGQRAAFRARFCALDDGGAAERVVRRLWELS